MIIVIHVVIVVELEVVVIFKSFQSKNGYLSGPLYTD